MKKKWLMLGGTIGISSIVMATTGFTALAGSSGYEAYKTALKQTKTAKSVSVQTDFALTDNGTQISQANGTFKVDLGNKTASGSVRLGGTDNGQTLSLFKQPNALIWNAGANDVYYSKSEKDDAGEKDSAEGEQNDDWFNQQAETIIDALVGNLKNEVQASERQDGGSHISLSLDSAQIPAVAQALAPLALKQLTEGDGGHHGKQPEVNADDLVKSKLFGSNKLALTQNVVIKHVELQADIGKDHFIQQQQASITFTGKDASGASHEVTLNADVQLSSYNATTPDSFDSTGKKVVQVKHDHENER